MIIKKKLDTISKFVRQANIEFPINPTPNIYTNSLTVIDLDVDSPHWSDKTKTETSKFANSQHSRKICLEHFIMTKPLDLTHVDTIKFWAIATNNRIILNLRCSTNNEGIWLDAGKSQVIDKEWKFYKFRISNECLKKQTILHFKTGEAEHVDTGSNHQNKSFHNRKHFQGHNNRWQRNENACFIIRDLKIIGEVKDEL